MERATLDTRDRFTFEQQRRRPFGSTDRKENHGYCQESFQEDRKEAGWKKVGRKETRRQEIRKKSPREKSRAQEIGCKTQTQRRVHESDDAFIHARRGRRHAAASPH